jgi:hypothetical protein
MEIAMNIKLFSLGLGFALIATPAVHAVDIQTRYTPTNTTFAFDIDDVLLKRAEPISTTLWEYRWDLAKNIINPYLWYNVACLLYNQSTGSAYLELFKKQAPRLAQMVEHMTLDKKPLEGMENLVKTLRTQAYSMVIASNMSVQDFAYYKEKFSMLFGNFEYTKLVLYDAQGKLTGVKKPSITYFQELKTELAEQKLTKPNLIFIDDKSENVKAFEAQAKEDKKENNYRGIQFKNATQLQTELAKLGILTATTI